MMTSEAKHEARVRAGVEWRYEFCLVEPNEPPTRDAYAPRHMACAQRAGVLLPRGVASVLPARDMPKRKYVHMRPRSVRCPPSSRLYAFFRSAPRYVILLLLIRRRMNCRAQHLASRREYAGRAASAFIAAVVPTR